MTLIFVRHGQSEGNALRIWQGWSDYPLTALGRRQAEAAAGRLASMDAAALYSSDLRRASETAEIIASRLALPLEQRAGLRERCFGEGEGLTWPQIVERWGADVRVGLGEIPGEEPFVAFRERVAREFDELMDRHREEVAICVSHGGAINSVVAHVLELPPGARARLAVGNGSLTVVEMERGRPLLTSLNDDCHVQEGA